MLVLYFKERNFMKIKLPEPFTFEAGPRAVLLLHGFTGHSADVRMLGRFLEKHGYTSHAPIYRGHGKAPEELIKTTPADWWVDVEAAFEYLIELGYKEIAVCGLSLGGALALKLAASKQVKAVIPMCAPMFFDNETELTKGFQAFSKEFKQMEGKDEDTIDKEIKMLQAESLNMFTKIGRFINEIKDQVDLIYTPTMVVQARHDKMINPKSAQYIYDHVESEKKMIKWYEKSGHVITLGEEKDQLHEDILQFLDRLKWEE